MTARARHSLRRRMMAGLASIGLSNRDCAVRRLAAMATPAWHAGVLRVRELRRVGRTGAQGSTISRRRAMAGLAVRGPDLPDVRRVTRTAVGERARRQATMKRRERVRPAVTLRRGAGRVGRLRGLLRVRIMAGATDCLVRLL